MLERIYGERFPDRHYVIPFASTEARKSPRVIPVDEAGWYFSRHIAVACQQLYESSAASHFAFVADDLLLNPALDAESMIDVLRLAPDTAYIKSLCFLDSLRYRWHRAIQETVAFRHQGRSLDYLKELPSPALALGKFRELGIATDLPRIKSIDELRYALFTLPGLIGLHNAFWIAYMHRRPSGYPFLAGYSDFVVVPRSALLEFGKYCGVFAALNAFAEIAVPTALALSTNRIRTELPINSHFMDLPARARGLTEMQGCEFWDRRALDAFMAGFNGDVLSLLDAFPSELLYVHPVKLSVLV